jgi:hypothetical protein
MQLIMMYYFETIIDKIIASLSIVDNLRIQIYRDF